LEVLLEECGAHPHNDRGYERGGAGLRRRSLEARVGLRTGDRNVRYENAVESDEREDLRDSVRSIDDGELVTFCMGVAIKRDQRCYASGVDALNVPEIESDGLFAH
jgi:hypothetical protein